MTETITSESAAPHLALAVKKLDALFADEGRFGRTETAKAWRLVRATLKMRGERLNERQDF